MKRYTNPIVALTEVKKNSFLFIERNEAFVRDSFSRRFEKQVMLLQNCRSFGQRNTIYTKKMRSNLNLHEISNKLDRLLINMPIVDFIYFETEFGVSTLNA